METKIKNRKPRSPGSRFQSYIYSEDLKKQKYDGSSLIDGTLKKKGGRNCYGRITVRHRGGGAAKKYRCVDFNRKNHGIIGTIKDIHYDPNRNVPIALIFYPNGKKQYVLLAEGMKIGGTISSGSTAEVSIGNCLQLKDIPVGFKVHNLEITPNTGGKLVRSAGAFAQIASKEENYASVMMPSGEIRLLHMNCYATVGEVAYANYKNISIGKAGRNRHRGIRPSVRGMAMNPVDHPHGGGEGRTKSGKNPQSPHGKCAKGTKTRFKKSRFIIKRRK